VRISAPLRGRKGEAAAMGGGIKRFGAHDRAGVGRGGRQGGQH
jgi:hypothetical protein